MAEVATDSFTSFTSFPNYDVGALPSPPPSSPSPSPSPSPSLSASSMMMSAPRTTTTTSMMTTVADFGAKRLQPSTPVSGSLSFLSSDKFYFDVEPGLVSTNRGCGVTALIVKVNTTNEGGSVRLQGKLNSIPGLLSDVTEKEVDKRTWTIQLSRYTTPPLVVGRWFFNVIGNNFLQRTNYHLLVNIQSENELCRWEGDTIIEEVYENQRYYNLQALFTFYSIH
jgi:hypothetical protein